MLPLLRARRGVLDAHLGNSHLRHIDQSVDSKFRSDRRHGHDRFQVTGGYGHAEVDPPAAGNDAIDIGRFEEVSDDHLGPVHQLLRGFAVDARKTDIQAGLKESMAVDRAQVHLGVHGDIRGSLTFVQAATILIADR